MSETTTLSGFVSKVSSKDLDTKKGPATRYNYSVVANGALTNVGHFVTQGAEPAVKSGNDVEMVVKDAGQYGFSFVSVTIKPKAGGGQKSTSSAARTTTRSAQSYGSTAGNELQGQTIGMALKAAVDITLAQKEQVTEDVLFNRATQILRTSIRLEKLTKDSLTNEANVGFEDLDDLLPNEASL